MARISKVCGLTRVIGTEPEDNITIVGHGNCVLSRRQVELPVEKASSVQIQGVLQVNLLHIPIWGPPHANNMESIAMKMEGMAQVWLLNCKTVLQCGEIKYWNISG
jgi:hypothetical protein